MIFVMKSNNASNEEECPANLRMVLHSPNEIVRLSDQIVRLRSGNRRIQLGCLKCDKRRVVKVVAHNTHLPYVGRASAGRVTEEVGVELAQDVCNFS